MEDLALAEKKAYDRCVRCWNTPTESKRNPHNILFSWQDEYGHKNFISYYNENELTTMGIIKGWSRVGHNCTQ